VKPTHHKPSIFIAALVAGLTIHSLQASVTILHNFTVGPSDGRRPYGSLTLSGSTLYGMTQIGGSNDTGALFSMNTDGSGFSLLHSFTGGASDGAYPNDSLTLSGSKLYGMTNSGGSYGTGTLFSMNTDGSGYSLLHSFTGGASDGGSPQGSLKLSGSTLYGMTRDGGSNHTGALFSMNTDGTGFSLLHSFTGGASDGASPQGSLTLSGSKLYGMTSAGGSSSNYGALFSMNTDGSGFSLIHSLTGGASDGAYPQGSLTLSGSTLYGMTRDGGTADQGVVFSKMIMAVPEPQLAMLVFAGFGAVAARRRRVHGQS
jgi:uncharacterized repeat protein (TIGR03803 family)